jgi:hypothetical protein
MEKLLGDHVGTHCSRSLIFSHMALPRMLYVVNSIRHVKGIVILEEEIPLILGLAFHVMGM